MNEIRYPAVVFTKDKPALDRLIAALVAREVKTFVIPTALNLWRAQPMTEADAARLEAADVLLYQRTTGVVCVWVGQHNGNAFDTDKLSTIVAKLEAAPLGPAMAMRILRDIA